MKMYLARFFINKGWGLRIDNEYKQVESRLFRSKSAANAWIDEMDKSTSHHSEGLVETHEVY